ncbi:MAG TPA: S8 family serine peptidase, partial [Nitriliruptorales bacterium]
MGRRFSVLLLLASALALLGSSIAIAAPNSGAHERVIVVLHDGTDAREAARDAARDYGAEVTFVYEHALSGFAAQVPAGRVNALRNDPRVSYVEADRLFHTTTALTGNQLPTGVDRIDADANTNLKLDGVDDARVDARVAVIDTGVDFDHSDLNVNTTLSVNCLYTTGGGPPWSRNYVCITGEGDDDNGHGTHVAGTI